MKHMETYGGIWNYETYETILCKLRKIKRNCSKTQFVKTTRSIKMKENKEWILTTLKSAIERYFLKTTTPKFWKCKEK